MSSVPIGVRFMKSQAPYYEDLGNVTGVSYNTGRQNITDNWSGSSIQIYGRVPSAITNYPTIGQPVVVYWGDYSLGGFLFSGIVADWRIIYGITPAYDTWELTLESGWALAGRKTATGAAAITTTAGYSTAVMAYNCSLATGSTYPRPIEYSPNPIGGWGSTTSAQTYDGQIANALTALMQTEQGFIRDQWIGTGTNVGKSVTTLFGRNAYSDYVQFTTLTDSATQGSNEYRYTEIEFLSAATNYGVVVNVSASGFATQTVGSGDYAQNYQTINGSASEAANLAGYVQAELNLATAVPYRVTTTWGATSSQAANALAILCRQELIHAIVTIKFRGNTYNCLIEGITLQASPTGWTLGYNLSSSLQNAFLRLDNAVLGTLDNNRLGF